LENRLIILKKKVLSKLLSKQRGLSAANFLGSIVGIVAGTAIGVNMFGSVAGNTIATSTGLLAAETQLLLSGGDNIKKSVTNIKDKIKECEKEAEIMNIISKCMKEGSGFSSCRSTNSI